MHRIRACLLSVALCLAGCAKEPATYEDCILKNLTAGQSGDVSRAIMNACATKFGIVQKDVVEYRGTNGVVARYRNGKLEKVIGRYDPAPSKQEFTEDE